MIEMALPIFELSRILLLNPDSFLNSLFLVLKNRETATKKFPGAFSSINSCKYAAQTLLSVMQAGRQGLQLLVLRPTARQEVEKR